METKKKSPCLVCTRVKDPSSCDNKICPQWRGWFLRRWAEMRAYMGIKVEGEK